jgi:hypothetical protein
MKETRRATYEILRDVRDAMNKKVIGKTGTNWIDNLDGTFTLQTCSTLWVRQGTTVNIGGTDYPVSNVVNNTSITITAASAPLVTEFDLSLPKFWHGTIRFTDEELSRISNEDDKFPMIFLHEPTTERHNYNAVDNLGMESDCTLYFMTPADFTQWSQDDHYNKAVAAMRNMRDEFVNALFAFRGVVKEPRPDGISEDRVKWGKAVFNGNEVQLIAGDLSGTSLKISPQFEKSICCCNC